MLPLAGLRIFLTARWSLPRTAGPAMRTRYLVDHACWQFVCSTMRSAQVQRQGVPGREEALLLLSGPALAR